MRKDTQIINLGRATALLLGLACAAGARAGTPSLASQQAFTAGHAPTYAVSMDVNGDGMPDLVTTDVGGSAIMVLLNTATVGATSASYATAQSISTDSAPWCLVAADVNGDGKPDLIMTYEVGDAPAAHIAVLINTTVTGSGTASFAAPQDFATGNGNFPWLASADIDGDGKPDLVVSNDLDNTVSVLLNQTVNGSGTAAFAASQDLAVGASPSGLAFADMDSDGKAELLVSNLGDCTVEIMQNFSTSGSLDLELAAVVNVGLFAGLVETGDLNGDGIPDIIVANNYGDYALSVVINLTQPGDTDLSFGSEQDFGTRIPGPNAIVVADLDGDGMADLATVNYSGAAVTVYQNTATVGGSTADFAAGQDFAAGTAPYSVLGADVNGDGKIDLVSMNMGSHGISVLLNTAP